MRDLYGHVWARGLTAVVLGGLSVVTWAMPPQPARCTGDPSASLRAYQKAVQGSQGWDDLSFQAHLTQAARQRLAVARAKVDFSATLGQGGPLQGWPAGLSLDERKASAQKMFLSQVAAWPLDAVKFSADAQGMKASFHWEAKGLRGDGEAAVSTHAVHDVTVTLRCEGAQWRVDQEAWKRQTVDMSSAKGAAAVPGSPFREEWVWP
ncbi:MAG: hypothetical protein RLZZ182_2541 [Pseudomonadota bacterium]|jgi:hypothetical protein